MILPIHVYGSPVLLQQTVEIEANSDALQELIDNMIETMYGAHGIGLAAPQVGRLERVFVIDVSPMLDEDDEAPEQPMVFINPEIIEEGEEDVEFEEGCLSIPDIREYVIRPDMVRVRYLDRQFQLCEVTFSGLLARVVQHEYDHLDGVLFIDLISPFRRRLLKRKLRTMTKGEVEADYPLVPPVA